MSEQNPKDLFRIRDHVAEFDDVVAAFRQVSTETRNRLPGKTDIRYGDQPGETLDLFFPPRESWLSSTLPVHIFIHGGYWRMFSKDDFSYIADTVTAAGAIAVILDYVLMPSQRLAVLVEQVRKAATWVTKEIGAFGGNPRRLSVSGHSAGAHLATWLVDTRDQKDAYRIRSSLLLGGLYDLRPLQESFLQAEIGLADDEVECWTPLFAGHQTNCQFNILVGEEETPPFHEQASAFYHHLAESGCRATLASVPATNHMTSALSLGNPASFAGRCLIDTIRT